MKPMTDLTFTKLDESYIKVGYTSQAVAANLSDYFSYFAEGYQFNPKFKYTSWDGKVRLFNKTSNKLPIGLLTMLPTFMRSCGYTTDTDFREFMRPAVEFTNDELVEYSESFKAYSGDTEIEPYWYQKEAFVTAMSSGRSLLNLPTSAGKSLIQAMISRFMVDRVFEDSKVVLIIVPTISLVTQMGDDFRDYRVFNRSEIQYIMGGEGKRVLPGTKVVISTWQSAIKLDPDWFDCVGALICDESHLATGKSLQEICMNYCTAVPWKIGLTGTVKDGKASILLLRAIFGEIYRPVTTKQLQDEGQISGIDINVIQLEYDDETRQKFKKLKPTYQTEIGWITENQTRNGFISSLGRKLASKNDNVLILFNYQKHGEAIVEAIKDAGYEKVMLVYGKSDKEVRSTMRGIMEAEGGWILVASYGVLSTGVSIKRLNHVMFAHPMKAKVKVLQSIGRGLRKHDEKDKMTLWDIVDDLSVKNTRKNAKNKFSYRNYGLLHFGERAQLYIAERFEYKIKKWSL